MYCIRVYLLSHITQSNTIFYFNIHRYENQIKKCLSYFDSLRRAQLQRRRDKDEDWEQSFLASTTWRNLRISCRGFFAYCRAVMKYSDANQGTVRPVKAISPAHSNSSNIEAWFAFVRMSNGDLASQYAPLVANSDMIKAIQSLRNNKMYSGADAGEEEFFGQNIGPKEFIKIHTSREQKMLGMIEKHESSCQVADVEISAFSPNVSSVVPLSLSTFERKPLLVLSKKTLQNGYLATLLQQDMFQKWLRLSINQSSGAWFSSLLDNTLRNDDLMKFDTACQRMQDKIYDISVKSLVNRGKDTGSYCKDAGSFEYHLHRYHNSNEFTALCKRHLGDMAENRAGCVLLFLSLSRMHSDWMKDALTETRRDLNPELFDQKDRTKLTPTEENNEVNRFMGWAIFSALGKYTKDGCLKSDQKCGDLLSSMFIREGQMDDDYLNKYYDSHMCLLNRGGLTLVNKHWFEWSKRAMKFIRTECNENRIKREGQHAFDRAKTAVMTDSRLRQEFMSLCNNNHDAGKEVYTAVLQKAMHARFAVVFRQWKETNVDKRSNVALRTFIRLTKKEKAGDSTTAGKKRKNTGGSTSGKKKKAATCSITPEEAKLNRKKRKDYMAAEQRRQKRLKNLDDMTAEKKRKKR